MSATYTLTPAGDIVFEAKSRGVVTQTITVDAEDNLGLFFDTEDGVLHKHGSAKAVDAYARQIRATYADNGFKDIADSLVFVQIPVAAMKIRVFSKKSTRRSKSQAMSRTSRRNCSPRPAPQPEKHFPPCL